jgi:hypothetical protein
VAELGPTTRSETAPQIGTSGIVQASQNVNAERQLEPIAGFVALVGCS